MRKAVYVHISSFERTSRIRMQNLLYTKNTYFVRTSRLEHTSRIHTQKDAQPTQSCLQGAKAVQPTYADCYSRIEQIDKKRIKRFKRHGMRRAGQVHTSKS